MEKAILLEGFLTVRAPALEAFLASQRPGLLRLCLSILGRSDLAEDACQEALLRASKNWAEVSRMDRPEAWVRVVAARRSLSLLSSVGSSGELPELAVSADRTEAIAVHQTLAKLDSETRTLLALAVGQQWSYEEIAQALEIPIGTVGSRLNAAKKAFRKAWGDER